MVISGSHPLLGDMRLGDACLPFSQLLQPPPCSRIVVKSLKGLMWDPHLGLIFVMVIRRARIFSYQMVTRKISVKVRCEKAIPGFPASPRAHAKTANAGSSALGENPIHHRHLVSDHLEISLIASWAVAQLEMLALPYWAKLWFVLSLRDAGLGWTGHCFGILGDGMSVWTIRSLRGRGEFTDILIHIPGLVFHLFICTNVPWEREGLINVPPLEGWSSKGSCCLHRLCVLLSLGIGGTCTATVKQVIQLRSVSAVWYLGWGPWGLFVLFSLHKFRLCGPTVLLDYKWQKMH